MTTPTPIRWNTLSPRERDDLIEEVVFGTKLVRCPFVPAEVKNTDVLDDKAACEFHKAYPNAWATRSKHYTSCYDDSFAVVEKMREKGWSYQLRDHVNGPNLRHIAFFAKEGGGVHRAEHTSLPEAISMCALRAHGIEVERE